MINVARYRRIGLAVASAAAGALLAPVAAPAVLGMVGFGAAGPIAGVIVQFSVRQ